MTRILTITLLLLCATGWGQQLNKGFIQTYPDQVAGLGGFVSVGGGVNYNDSAVALFNKMPTQPSTLVKQAISEAIDSLQYYNLAFSGEDTLHTLQVYAAESAQNALVDWCGRSNGALVNESYMIFSPKIGFFRYSGASSTSDVSTQGYIDTGVNPANINGTMNNMGWGIYVFDSHPTATPFAGVYDNSAGILINPSWISVEEYSYFMSTSNSYAAALNVRTAGGLYQVNRIRSNLMNPYYNGTLKTASAGASTSLPNKNIYVHTYNNNGTQNNGYRFNRCSAFYIGSALTAIQNKKIYEIIHRYLLKINSNDFTLKEETADFESKTDMTSFDKWFYRVGVDSNRVLGVTGDSLLFSVDGGSTYPYKIAFSKWKSAEFAVLFKNGNILVAGDNKIYISKYSLQTLTEVIVTLNGTPYTYHTPVAARYSGSYFRTLNQPTIQRINNKEICVWGNYANIWNGATPINIYATTDAGDTVKIIYQFGNLITHDNGQASGSKTTGTLLPNNDNWLKAEHIHNVAYCSKDTSWYICTDYGTTYDSIALLKAKYNFNTRLWSFDIKARGGNYRFMTMIFEGDSVILARDHSDGIYKSSIANFTTPATWKHVYTVAEISGAMVKSNGIYFSSALYGRQIYWSKNGITWNRYTLQKQLMNR